jgi:hypothetical protein
MPLSKLLNRWFPPYESPPDPPAGAVISTDLPCRDCRYNLKTLPAEASCPECGLAIADSVHPFRRPRELQFAINLLLIAFASLVFRFPGWNPSVQPGTLSMSWAVASRVLAAIFICIAIHLIRNRNGLTRGIGVGKATRRMWVWMRIWMASLVVACIVVLAAPTPLPESALTRLSDIAPTAQLRRLLSYFSDYTVVSMPIASGEFKVSAFFMKPSVRIYDEESNDRGWWYEFDLKSGEKIHGRDFPGAPLWMTLQSDGLLVFESADGDEFKLTAGAYARSPLAWTGLCDATVAAMMISSICEGAICVSLFTFAQFLGLLSSIVGLPRVRYFIVPLGAAGVLAFWVLGSLGPLFELIEWRVTGVVPSTASHGMPFGLDGMFPMVPGLMCGYAIFVINTTITIAAKVKLANRSWKSVIPPIDQINDENASTPRADDDAAP